MKKLLKRFLPVGLGVVIFMAGVTSESLWPATELVSSSYAGSFGKGDAGPAWTKCKNKCNGASFPSYCCSGCDYYYSVVSAWTGSFDKGNAGPGWVKCKDKCMEGWSSSGKYLLCNVGCEHYYNIISNW
ncbi:MAG: hypothetical protein CVU71_10005 [Deltaproteobacteria bacterium HGW-Deltaproteobacteria-6]|nr:MAG: hypothetical protein CVU71_10005 [Deltaproteobacteria bacterium HGW-Deltaproteobacteria-6]